jgi:hypothetical protein
VVSDQSIVSQITELRQQQEALLSAAREERIDLLSKLAGLCALLGPLTRAELPDGVLRRRERKAAKVVKVRKVKAATEEK